ncbi:MAG: hypothetical protein O7H41_00220 [Planctomycetota bacterium]|nr:hypothetical protein [Planctomycetota bacterium]
MSLSKISEKLKVDRLFKARSNGQKAAPKKPKARFLLVGVEDKLQKYMEAIAGKDASEFTKAADTERALKLLKTHTYHGLVVSSPHVDPTKAMGKELIDYIRDNRLASRITFLSSDEANPLMPKMGNVQRGKVKPGASKEDVKRFSRFRTVPLTTQHIYQVVNEVARNPFDLPQVTLLTLMGFNDRLRLAIAGAFSVVLAFIVLSSGGESTPAPIQGRLVREHVVINPHRAPDGTYPARERMARKNPVMKKLLEIDRQVREALKESDQRPKGHVRPGTRWEGKKK